jgi:plasmid stabilization system protein ParE
MAPATILFHRLARQEYQKAFRWYARRSYQAALGFESEVIRALQRIAATPDRWPVFQGLDRFVRVRRYSYALYYRIVDPTRVLIMAVAHTSRRLGYWRRRKGP